MRCADFRKTIATLREDELLPQTQRELSEHSKVCPQCRDYAERMRATVALLGRLSEAKLPGDFNIAVQESISQLQRRRVGWLDRLLGDLRAPAPRLGPGVTGLAAVGLLLLAATGFIATRLQTPQPSYHIASNIAVTEVSAVGLTYDAIEDLVFQHEGYVTSQPLGDDSGIQMISHSLGE